MTPGDFFIFGLICIFFVGVGIFVAISFDLARFHLSKVAVISFVCTVGIILLLELLIIGKPQFAWKELSRTLALASSVTFGCFVAFILDSATELAMPKESEH